MDSVFKYINSQLVDLCHYCGAFVTMAMHHRKYLSSCMMLELESDGRNIQFL